MWKLGIAFILFIGVFKLYMFIINIGDKRLPWKKGFQNESF